MGVIIVSGDLFASGAEALVNPVNCEGVSGKGLALEFKRRFPHAEKAYRWAAKAGFVRLGGPFIHDRGAIRVEGRWIVHFPTKRRWRDPSRLWDIEAGANALYRWLKAGEVNSIAIPALGCGLGGLDFADVRALFMEPQWHRLATDVQLFEPQENG